MRETSYNNPFRLGSLYCPNVLVRCADFRFHGALEATLAWPFIPMGGGHSFASVGVPGGSRAIIDEDARKVVFAALDIALKRHEANRVIIADHLDCAAYGGSDLHQDPEEEERFHLGKLREAYRIVKAAYPRLEVVLLYQDWERIKEVEAG